MKHTIYITLVLLLSLASNSLFSQRYPERRFIRQGNKEFQDKKFAESEVAYRRALERDSTSLDAQYNLAGAMYSQERYEDANKIYTTLSKDSSNLVTNKSEVHYNSGNALFKEKKYQEAIEQYKSSLRINPTDQEAKFNLAYAKKMLQDQQNKDQNKDNKDNKDQNKDKQDQNKDQQNKDKNKDKQDQDQDKQDQNKDQQDQGKDKKDQNSQQQQGAGNKVDKREAEQMLEAVQQGEDKTREKIDKKKAKVVGRSGKNW